MRLLTVIRWTGAIWFVPVVFAVGVFVGLTGLELKSGYSVSDLAAASIELILVAPIHAAFTALRFRAFPRHMVALRPVRSGLRVLALAWWPLLLGVPTAAVLAMFSAAGAVPNDAAGWQVVAVVFGTVFACGCLGLGAVRALPVVVAIPAVGVACYAWLALPGAGTNKVLRYMNSSFVGCCSTDQRPATAMVWASLALVGILAVGVLVPLVPRSWARQPSPPLLVGVAVTLGLAFAASAAVARTGKPLNLLAVQARTTQRVCTDRAVGEGSVRVCVWPENKGRLDEAAQAVAALNQGVARYGLPGVRAATEDAADVGAVDFSAPSYSQSADLAYSLAFGYVEWTAGCVDSLAHPAPQPSATAIAFIALGAGADRRDAVGRFTPATLQQADHLLSEPSQEAKAAFEDLVRPARARC